MKRPTLTIFYQFNPWDSSIGGIQTFIRSFIKYAPDEFQVRLVGIGDGSSLLGVWQKVELDNKSIEFLPLINLENDNVRGLIPTTVKYTAALLGRNYASDFMHFHRLEPTMATFNWSGDKTLFVHNDIEAQINPEKGNDAMLWSRFTAVYSVLERRLIRQFDRIYSCNSESARYYQQNYSQLAKQVTLIKNIVDTDLFFHLPSQKREHKRQTLARKLNLNEQTHFVLFVGRLHPQKDPILLIRAFSALSEPNAHLLIAGDGELAEAVDSEICAHNLSERVTLLGALKQEKLVNLYRSASVFVLSSLYEGLPIAVLEALACGTPIVTTDCGETPNLLTANSGVVAQERTPEARAAALSQVLQNPTAFPTDACVSVAQPYTAKAVVGNVYQQMLILRQKKNLAFPVTKVA